MSTKGNQKLCSCGHPIEDHDQYGCLYVSCHDKCKRKGKAA